MKVGAKKIVIVGVLVVVIVGVVFMSTEVLFSRNEIIHASLDGKDSLKIEKYEKDNKYYVSFKVDDKNEELQCTKEQYTTITNDKPFYILYSKNFLNRNEGKILKVDSLPIDNSLR